MACGIAAIAFSSCTKSARETSYDKKSYVELDGLKWATKNAGATKDTPYGNLYTYEQALKACPDGWRLPTYDELVQLSRFYSAPLSYDGMNGMWFSGSIPYTEGVDAVFFPLAGYNEGEGREDVDSYGTYWSSTAYDSNNAYYLDFNTSSAKVYDRSRYSSFSVRCLKN